MHADEEHSNAPGPRKSILVVEDDPSMRDLLRVHLANAGYEVDLAPDAIVAGYRIVKRPPDLIVLDVDLPHMSGVDLAAVLLADRTLPPIALLFLTAHENMADKAVLFGATCLLKPCTKGQLLRAVAAQLERPFVPPAEASDMRLAPCH